MSTPESLAANTPKPKPTLRSIVPAVAYLLTALLALLALGSMVNALEQWVTPRDNRTAAEVSTARAVELKLGLPAYGDPSYAQPLGRVYPFEPACYPQGGLPVVGRVNDASPWVQIELATGCGSDAANGKPLPAPGKVWINMNDLMLNRETWAKTRQTDPREAPPPEPMAPLGASAALTPLPAAAQPERDPSQDAPTPPVAAEGGPMGPAADAPADVPTATGAASDGGFFGNLRAAISNSSALNQVAPTATGAP